MGRGIAVVLALICGVDLAACVGGPVAVDADEFLTARGLTFPPVPDAFDYCWDHSCTRISRIGLSAGEWSDLVRPLEEGSGKPEMEREKLRVMIADFERRVAVKAGTSADRGGTMSAYGAGGQLDCVDETANTTVFLAMLDRAGLLRHHRPSAPAGRGNFLDGVMPHRTAAIVERTAGTEYAVDSWFHDNGQPPEIVPMAQWLSGWSPKDSTVMDDAAAEMPTPAEGLSREQIQAL